MYFRLALFLIILTAGTSRLMSQISPDSLQIYYDQKTKITSQSLNVLTYWSLANIGVGVAGSFQDDVLTSSFSQMNALWGGANLLVALAGKRIHKFKKNQKPIYYREILDQKKTQRTYLYASGFDLIFIAGGAYMTQYTNDDDQNQQDRIRGFGYSIAIQGTFLLGLDLITYFAHKRNGKRYLNQEDSNFSFYPGTIIYRF